ncbi:phosphatidylinositol phosphatase PTPRQ isoform X1 [Bufo bufo]|uniref:phosphatidylinositol phosphatase PTPRQ isoform X1 n=1 Tax=Bufo bufo TaxID=8384 RepID=UPI001ABDD1D1|nr:phosphatidylinositol phosphatase PTPRQ isoform X1 [Bufo bufo]
MDSIILRLLLFKGLFQVVQNVQCGEKDTENLAVRVEWNTFPENKNPDSYFVLYHTNNSTCNQNVLKSPVAHQAYSPFLSLNTLKKEDAYNFTIKSMKDGEILSVKSFLTDPIQLQDVAIAVTTTSVSFNWSKINADIFVSNVLNNSTEVMLLEDKFYEVNNLRPGSLCNFEFVVKQHYPGFINVSRKMYIPVETGLCSEGWVALKHSCYKLILNNKPWASAEQSCEMLHAGAHLVNVQTTDEHAFLSSFLYMKNELILLWSGLSDLEVEQELLWTDGSAYTLDTYEVTLLSYLPKNYTDCYALQQNATGPNYFYTAFFCHMALPYLCEYEFPDVSEKLTYSVEDISESEVLFRWSRFPFISERGFYPHLKYYSNSSNERFIIVRENSTYASIQNLNPGLSYSFILCMKDEKGSQQNLSPIISVQTRPLNPMNFKVGKISSTSISLKWNPPVGPFGDFFCGYLVTVWDIEKKSFLTFKEQSNQDSTTIQDLKAYHKYTIFLQSIAESGKLSSLENSLLVITEVSPLERVSIEPNSVQEDNLILYWDSPEEFHQIYIRVKSLADNSEVSYVVNDTDNIHVGALIPGMTYEIGLSVVVNGNRSEMKILQQTLRPKPVTLAVPIEQNTHDVELFVQMPNVGIFDGILISNAKYKNRSISFPLMAHGKYVIDQLVPGTEYSFIVHTRSKDMLSAPFRLSSVKTCLASPTNVREGEVAEHSIQVIWDRADGNFHHYEIICKNCSNSITVQKVTQKSAVFTQLTPGTTYTFSVSTEKQFFRDSVPVTLQIQTTPSSVTYVNYTTDTTSIIVNWQLTSGLFDGYIISLKAENTIKTEMVQPSERQYIFTGLLPGFEYVISIITRCGLKQSSPAVLKLSTDPEPPSAMEVVGQEEHSIYLSWKPPHGRYEKFQLTYQSSNRETFHKVAMVDNEAVIKNLLPGEDYIFQLQTIKGEQFSVPIEKTASTRPAGICGLSSKDINTTSATLHWDPVGSSFTHYRILIKNQTYVRDFNVSKAEPEYTATHLYPGGIYNVTVQRVKGNFLGDISSIQVVAEPEAPIALTAFNISTHSFSIYWRQPHGRVERYQVDLFPQDGFVAVRDLGGGEYQADVSSIAPGTTYRVAVSSVSSSAFSSPDSKLVMTNETIPGPPDHLAGERVGSAGILLSWSTPRNTNGKIIGYAVNYREVCPWMQSSFTQVVTTLDSLEVLLTSLTPGTTYEIKVAAENSAGIGSYSDSFLFNTAESAPGKVVNLTVEALNSSAVNLTWFLPTQPHGKIISFKISVKHARTGAVVKDTTVKVEDILNGALPECTEKSESFLWSTSSPSSTRGQSTTTASLIAQTITSGTFNAIWNEPITYIVGQLRPYTTYLFEVSAVTSEPGYIDSTIVRTPESVPEDPPRNLVKGNITARSFSVTWDAPTIVTGKFSYKVELYGPTGRILDNSTKDLKFTFTNLTPFTAYDAYISGETSAGVGPRSNISVFTPAEVPSAVSDLNAKEVEANFITVTWRRPQQPNGIITQYRVRAFVKETGLAIENTILTGKYKYPYNMVSPTSTIVNENTKSLLLGQLMSGVYEGSADIFPTAQSMSPVAFYNNPNGDTVVETVQAGIDIEAEQLSYTVERLLPYSDYTISVSAFTTVGEGPPTYIVIRTSEQVPSSVNNISYQNISSTSVIVFWIPPLEPNGMITHYTVYAMDLYTKDAFHVTTSNTSMLITGLKKYMDYKVRVTASNSAGESAVSEENNIFVRTLEDAPGSPPQNLVSAGVNATAINLEWLPPAEPNGIITHYEIIYTNSTVILAQNTSSRAFTVTDLNPYTLYRISVRAYTQFGHGNQSTPILSVKTSETAPSSPPYDLLYRNLSSTRVLLTWQPPVFANGIIMFYKINYWNSTNSLTEKSNDSLIVLSDLKKYSQYQVVVSGQTIHGDGNQTSEILHMTTMEDVPDDPPYNLSYRILNSTSIQLFYSPPSSPNGVIKYYTITCLDAAASEQNYKSYTQSAIITDFKKYSEYSITISASTSVGPGPRTSRLLFVRTGEDVPDSAPENIVYRNVSSTEIAVSYSPPTIPNGKISYYTVYITWLNGTVERATDTPELSLNVAGLRKHTSYILKLSASTAKGEGVHSEAVSITTEEDAPSTPPRLLAVSQLSSTLVKLSWLPPLEPNGIILFYTLYIWDETSNKTIYIEDTSVDFIDFESNHEYSAYVTSSTRFGDGNVRSDTLRFKTLEGVPSDPPKNVSYRNLTSTSVKIFWNPPVKPNGVILYYTLYFKNSSDTYIRNLTSGDISIPSDGNDLSATIHDLAKFRHYEFWITASTIFGDGDQASEVIDVNTEEDVPESGPMIREYKNLTSTSVLLSWDPPEHPNGIITGYYLQIYGPQGNYPSFATQVSVILEDLLPFTQYFVFVAASTIKGTGPPSQLAFHTDEAEPTAPPQNLTFINASANSAWLQWSPSPKPNGIVRTYSFRIVENSSQSIFYQNISGDQTEGMLTNLEPFKTYLASMSAFTKVGNGNEFSNTVSFATEESGPDSIQNIHCVATSWQSILVQWDPPLRPNGIITHYILTFQSVTTTVLPTDTVYTFRDLLSNTTYYFTVKASNSAGEGVEQVCNATTKFEEVPSVPRSVTILDVGSTSVTLQWNRPEYTNGYLKSYKINVLLLSTECNVNHGECIEKSQDLYSYQENTVEKTIYGLKKFRWYRFKVSASTTAGYGASSPWINVQTLSGPAEGPPQNVTVIATSSNSINISWNQPAIITGPTSYLINISSANSAEYTNEIVRWSNESINIQVITGLKPFTNYSIVVIAFTGDLDSAFTEGKPSKTVTATTLEAVPNDPPKNITIQKIPNEVTKVQMTFIPPAEPNGKIQMFQALIYKEDDPTKSQIRNLSIIKNNEESVTAIIEGLKGGYTYNISIYAVNGAGAGPKIQMRITTDIKEPPRPVMKPVPIYDSSGSVMATSTTITIKMPVCYFSDVNGPIKKIQILVSEIGAQQDGNITKWHEAYFQKPRPYFTNEGFPNPSCPEGTNRFFSKQEVYVIGADNTCMLQENKEKFCNGPLKPRKQYLFKFRATNTRGQFTDSEYSEVVKTLADGLSGRAVEIILSVTLCVLSVILLVAAIYAFARIRQKQKEGGTYSPRDAEIIDTKFKLDQLITVADLELKDERLTRYSSFFFRRKDIYVIQLLSYRKSLKPVSKKTFLQHIEELCANNNLKFQEEFSELPKFLEDLAVSDADLPWNRSKNRFTNIKPYNNNRVKLIADAGVPGSDYINASYVSGYICPNEFIATQGPLAGTVGDFWRMVWETRAKTIVMLTQCFEKGRIRCHQYWPEDNKPVTVFGDIVITKVVEDVQIDWTIRDLKVERHGDYMMVRQHNFTSWPEHGVPENTTALIHFVKMVRASRPHENTPTIVHCSAGVGRSGVFVAMDHLIQHINHHDFVDIYGLVAELRSERMCMVQNLAQYIFLHQCAVDLLATKGSNQAICFVNYSALQKMDSLDAMEGDVELEWEETTM